MQGRTPIMIKNGVDYSMRRGVATATPIIIAESETVKCHSSHLYADDRLHNSIKHLQLKDVANATDEIMLLSISMRLKLNPTKSELIWFDRSSKLLTVHRTLIFYLLQLLPTLSIVPCSRSWSHP